MSDPAVWNLFHGLGVLVSDEVLKRDDVRQLSGRFDSPLESVACLAVCGYCVLRGIPFLAGYCEEPIAESGTLTVTVHYPIDRYVADLLVCHDGRRVAVEVDGHDFHERTKEQAAHDKERDRTFQQLGFTVFRFTGSEVFHDPAACALEIVAMAMGSTERP